MIGIKILTLWLCCFPSSIFTRYQGKLGASEKPIQLKCSQLTQTGHLQKGVDAFMVAVLIPYSNGNGQSYQGLTIASNGVAGLIAQLAPGKLEIGDGLLVFNISGKPVENGLATFKGTFFKQPIQFSRIVDPILCK